jgi:hypothetical protein
MLAMGGGLAAGIVLGARVPIVMPARADSLEVRMASCVLASLLVAAARDGAPEAPAAPGKATDPASGARVAA